MMRIRLFVMCLAIQMGLSQSLYAFSLIDEIDAQVFGVKSDFQAFRDGVRLFQEKKFDEALGKFQLAQISASRELKSKALHNAAFIHIQKNELPMARDLLKQALAHDNDNQAIRENLAWVESQLKDQNPEEKNAQDDQDQKASDQKSAEEKNSEQKPGGESEEKEEKKQDSQAKDGENKGKDQDKEKNLAQGADPKENAAKEKNKEKEAQAEQNTAEAKNDKNKADDSSQSQTDKPEEKGQEGKKADKAQATTASQQSPEDGKEQAEAKSDSRYLVTPEEIRKQEAERMLRSVDDKIGRYPLIDTEATRRRGSDGKNW